MFNSRPMCVFLSAAMPAAAVVLGFASAGPPVEAAEIDLTNAGAFEPTPNGGWVLQGNDGNSSGSGTFPFFVKVGENDTETRGVNDPDQPLQTKDVAPGIRLSDMVSAGAYYEFSLDVNQPGSNSIIFVEEIEIYLLAAANPTDIVVGNNAALGNLVFDIAPDKIKLDASLSSGGGHADVLLYVPKALFASTMTLNPLLGADPYVYLYSHFSNNDGGFEEWGLREGDAPAPPVPPVPLPASAYAGLGLLATLAVVRKLAAREA